MGQDLNTVALIGRLTRDGELKYTGSGMAICHFSLAVGRRVKKGDQWTDETSFFDMALFDKKAEGLHKYLIKGQQIAVSGSLEQQWWEHAGKTMSKVAVRVNDIQLIGGKREGSQASGEAQRPAQQSSGHSQGAQDFDPSVYDSDIPF